tara:strand:- start:9 stop:2798 length:2790 start_codon:yes stop_codon:yes gene_type:complete
MAKGGAVDMEAADARLQAAIQARMGGEKVAHMAGGGKLKALGDIAKKFLADAPQAEALKLAQQRAALPPAKGGLGLPADNTPEQRAAAMKRNTDAYHGSKQDITGAFRPGYDDNLAFVTKSPEFANKWIGKGKMQKRVGDQAKQELKSAEDMYRDMKSKHMDYDSLSELKGDEFHSEYDRRNAIVKAEAEKEFGLQGSPDKIHSTVYPLTVESNKIFNPETDMDVMAEFFKANNIPKELQDLYAGGNYMMYETKPVVEYLKGKGYDSMRLRESTGDDFPTIAVFNPESIRGRFAAHDPFRKDAATAAAMGVLAPDLMAEENKKAKGGLMMAGGGDPLDQFSPPRYRSAGRRPESQNDRRAAANMPMDFARGLVSGIGGAPGDIESLIRMLPGLDERTVLPTSEDIEKRLPFRSDTPAGQAASGLGTLAGGFYTGPGAPIRLVGGLPKAVVKAGKDFTKAAGQPATRLDVYHGSPHKFDRFDASKIGTGEGNQAYGHGLYLAENPEVAETYQKMVNIGPLSKQAKKFVRENIIAGADNDAILKAATSSKNQATRWDLEDVKRGIPASRNDYVSAMDEVQEFLTKNPVSQVDGSLYKVDLPDEQIAKMLDYDKHLSEQSPEVQKILMPYQKEIGGSFGTGEQTLKAIAFERRMKGLDDSPAAVSQQLRDMGIPGIKYLDNTSRGAGTGTRNFVTFPGEEQSMTILERNGQPMIAPAPEGMAHGGLLHMADAGRVFKDGLTTSGGTFSPEELGVSASDLGNLSLMDDKTWSDIKRNAPGVYEWAKQKMKDEASQLKSARGVKDFALRTGAQYLGGIPDLINFGLMGVDLVQSAIPSISKPESVLDVAGTKDRIPKFALASDKPYFGGEQYIDAMHEAGLLGENQFPIAETVAGVLAPAGLIKKLGKKGYQAYRDMKSQAPKKRRGGLAAMAR